MFALSSREERERLMVILANVGWENIRARTQLRVDACISRAVDVVTTEIGRSPRSYFCP